MLPEISVVTITYQCARYVKRCYFSLTCQSVKDWEWVIIDDGSNDETEAIIKSFSDYRIKYTKLASNEGRGKARNLALENITSEWCAVLDMDDMMDPRRLEYALRAKEQGYDFMVSSTCLIDDNLSIKGVRDVFYNKKLRLFTHATLCAKTMVFKSIRYSERRDAEDQRMLLLVPGNYSGQYLNRPLYIYHENASLNLTGASKANLAALKDTFSIFFIARTRKLDFNSFLYVASFAVKYALLNFLRLCPKLYKYTYSFRKGKMKIDAESLADTSSFLEQAKMSLIT